MKFVLIIHIDDMTALFTPEEITSVVPRAATATAHVS
jgi:hypothetical protein